MASNNDFSDEKSPKKIKTTVNAKIRNLFIIAVNFIVRTDGNVHRPSRLSLKELTLEAAGRNNRTPGDKLNLRP